MVFLIDFENVSNNGFVGIEELGETDKIIVFYSEKSCNITIATHLKLENSKAVKEFFGVKTGGKNALDFQLSSYLGYLISKDNKESYAIVSNDEGFNFVVNFWIEKGIDVVRCVNLFRQIKKTQKEELENILHEHTEDINKVGLIINKYKTKQGINNALVKEFGTEKTGALYKLIRPLIKDKKGK